VLVLREFVDIPVSFFLSLSAQSFIYARLALTDPDPDPDHLQQNRQHDQVR
jgi:hypothetical protein